MQATLTPWASLTCRLAAYNTRCTGMPVAPTDLTAYLSNIHVLTVGQQTATSLEAPTASEAVLEDVAFMYCCNPCRHSISMRTQIELDWLAVTISH